MTFPKINTQGLGNYFFSTSASVSFGFKLQIFCAFIAFKTIIYITAKQLQNINLSVKTSIQINLPLMVLCILIFLEFFEKYAHSYKMMHKHAKRMQCVILLDAYNSKRENNSS